MNWSPLAKKRFHKVLTDLDPSEVEMIMDYGELKDYKPGDILLEESMVSNKLFFIVDGFLKIISTNEKGNEVVQFFVGESKFCTILYSFDSGVISHESIVAITSLKTLVFSKKKLEELYLRLPKFKDLIKQITEITLIKKIQARNMLMGEEASVRYNKFILQYPEIIKTVPLGDIAAFLGITKQSLSRIRKNTQL